MTDRELLELAAKAAYIDWCAYFPDKLDSCSLCLQPNGKHWNPLTDDGDALRLAVYLGMSVISGTYKVVCDWVPQEDDGNISTHEQYGDDPYAATMATP